MSQYLLEGEGTGLEDPSLDDVSGSCNIEKAFLFGEGRWVDFRSIYPEMDSTLLMKALVIKVSDDCRLGVNVGGTTPPDLPGGGIINTGYRADIENYYYEEFSYEECDLNSANNYVSQSACEKALKCLGKEYANLIPESDLSVLANYMKENGGEDGTIWYDGQNPTVTQQLTEKIDACFANRHNDY